MHSVRKYAGVSIFTHEPQFWVGLLTAALFAIFGTRWLSDLSNQLWYGLLLVWLFTVMLWLSFGVVRHADCLAAILGEPYGTVILTLSVITIEVVMIAAIMLVGENNPTLARDTMFSVLMIVLNGMVGITLLCGGLRHHEQEYNLKGAQSYLAVLIGVGMLGLVLPRFTESTPDGSPSTLLGWFLMIESALLYGIFLKLQTLTHSHFFVHPDGEIQGEAQNRDTHEDHGFVLRTVPYHTLFLMIILVLVVVLAKNMAVLVDHGVEGLGAPQALGGFLVAALVLSPEALAAVRAALANRLQRSVNICLGSALATIGMTVPAVLAVGFVTGRTVELGLNNADLVLLAVTFMASILTFGSGHTNVLMGAIHLTLFISYVVLIFD